MLVRLLVPGLRHWQTCQCMQQTTGGTQQVEETRIIIHSYTMTVESILCMHPTAVGMIKLIPTTITIMIVCTITIIITITVTIVIAVNISMINKIMGVIFAMSGEAYVGGTHKL